MRAHGAVTQEALDRLKDGVEVEGVRYGPIEATLDRVQGSNVWLTIGLREGKNREVRKVLSRFSLDVNRLIRISFGPFQLLDLEGNFLALLLSLFHREAPLSHAGHGRRAASGPARGRAPRLQEHGRIGATVYSRVIGPLPCKHSLASISSFAGREGESSSVKH